MRKIRACLASFVVVIAIVLSCGIPTSMPILPKEVVVKVKPSVSVPLGRVNYNLYGGLNGGSMDGGKGSLNDILGASWLQDLLDMGVTIYDYRPPGDVDTTQKFLVHYRLDMEDILGGSGDFDLREYQDMLDELTGKDTEIISDVSFYIPSMHVEDQFDVTIELGQVTKQIDTNIGDLQASTAYLPVEENTTKYVFPYDVSKIPQNEGAEFSITLTGLKSLTLSGGTINFDFTLRYGDSSSLQPPSPPLGSGSKLVLSNFRLQENAASGPIKNVVPGSGSVELDSDGDTESLSIGFDGTKLPRQFDLVCDLEITGSGRGFFELDVKPDFKDYTISGVEELALSQAQIASLYGDFEEKTHTISGELGESFNAIVGEGNLVIDTRNLFPPLDAAGPNDEGWNLALDLSGLYVQQGPHPLTNDPGLSLGGPGQPLKSGDNDLHGETLNYNDVKIYGSAKAFIPDGSNKLTFRNFPGEGIKKDVGGVYAKQVDVNMIVSLLSEVKATAKDFGLDAVDQTIEQELSGDFSNFKPWLNYIQFQRTEEDPPDYGLGVKLEIEKLNIVGGLALYINAPDLGLDHVPQPLVNVKDPATGKDQENALLIFLNKDSGGYRLMGDKFPEKLHIEVKLGQEDPAAQTEYKDTKILTMKDVVPGETIEVTNAKAHVIFDWTEMSIKPKPHINTGDDDPLPDYPFTGTFPNKGEGEEGIDLSDIAKGFGFADEAEGGGLSAQLYISLIRQSFENGQWADDPVDDSSDPGGWGKNLQLDLPNLEFFVAYGGDNTDNNKSENLFKPDIYKGTGAWALSRPVGELLGDPKLVIEDTENPANPFMIYAASSLPEQDKAIPLENLAPALNKVLYGEKEGPLFFEYKVGLDENNEGEPWEIALYPEMLAKKVVVSVDLLMLVPLALKANPTTEAGAPVIITIDPDLGDGDLFGRKNPDDNEYFDMVSSFGFDIAIKNMAGLNAGKLFLENKSDVKKLKYRLPIVDFANPRGNHLSLDSGEMEKIKAIWPFIPQASIEFEPGDVLRIERNFNIELQSITVRAGGEYTFETGL